MAEWSTLIGARSREIRVSGSITFNTGTAVALTGDHIASFTITEGADSALTPGCVLCAECVLELANDAGQWNSGGSILGAKELIGSTLQLKLGVADGDTIVQRDLGAFVISGAVYLTSEAKIRITASDSIATMLSGAFSDTDAYPCTLSALWNRAAAQAGYIFSGTVSNGDAVIEAAPEWGEVSLRTAMGMIAAAAGCFVRIGRRGDLQIVPVWQDAIYEIGAEAYMRMDAGVSAYGPVDALIIGDATYYGTDAHTAIFPLTIDGNPLLANAQIAQGAANAIAGCQMRALEVTWRGDPELTIGSRIRITDAAGQTYDGLISGQTMTYASGFSAQLTCAVPTEGDAGVPRIITPEGGINAAMLTGAVNGNLISARSITADKLAARSVTAEKLEAGAVDAQSIAAVTAKIKSLTASSIATDQLAAALAAFQVVAAGSASFDAATIRHLISAALNVENTVSGEAFIKNLRVRYAQIVAATIGDLCIKASDGNYYRIDVITDDDGTVKVEATLTTVTEDEISQGHTDAGRVILATDITAENLSAANIYATYALVNKIDAARIDVGQLFAQQAFIDQLNTTDIRSNSFIQMMVGDATVWRVKITSSNADVLTDGSSTTLSARVYQGAIERTDDIPAARFRWRRSGDDPDADAIWNAAHAGLKTVTVSGGDVRYNAVYSCDVLDTVELVSSDGNTLLDSNNDTLTALEVY